MEITPTPLRGAVPALAVRPARMEELPALMEIYAAARRFMVASGNPNQWVNGHPVIALIREDIARGRCFVCCDEKDIPHGVFAMVPGPEAEYAIIRGRGWQPCQAPHYVVIHRLAGDGVHPGVFYACLHYAMAHSDGVRIDTHTDNRPMQHLLAKYGFVFCGEIRLADGRPRLAFQHMGA